MTAGGPMTRYSDRRSVTRGMVTRSKASLLGTITYFSCDPARSSLCDSLEKLHWLSQEPKACRP
jgi:hypothetical protein